MGSLLVVVQISSKGQVVIPARLRRELGLKTGQPLQVRGTGKGGVLFTPVDHDVSAQDRALERFRDWVKRTGRDLVEELHARRRLERRREGRPR